MFMTIKCVRLFLIMVSDKVLNRHKTDCPFKSADNPINSDSLSDTVQEPFLVSGLFLATRCSDSFL